MTAASCAPAIGVIGVEARWSSRMLADAVEKRTGVRRIFDVSRISADFSTGRVFCDGVDLTQLDALIVKKLGDSYNRDLLDRLEVLHYLHERGVPVFSKPATMMRLLDRLSCTVTLQLGNIPMPATVVTEEIDVAVDAVRRFGRAILKPLFTSKARGMEVVEASSDDLREQIERFRAAGNTVLYVQRMVELPGSDLGLAFLGGEYMACYARVAGAASWKTSTSAGGNYQPYKPSRELIDLAHRAQSLFDLDFTCVDIAETPDGPIVFEVSAFGGFRGLWEANGINPGELYVDHVLRRIGHDR